MASWDRLLTVRETVNAALEEKRKDKVIGNSLGARVSLTASGPIGGAARAASRRTCRCSSSCRTSRCTLGPADGPDELRVEVEKAPGVKCERCWRFVPSRPDRAGLGGHLRPLRRRAGRTGQPLTVAVRVRASRDLDRRRRSSSLDQVAKALVRRPLGAARERRP